ncbi:hypothetical protein HV425_00725 [Enterococcus faecium]|nr:hypothetical protein [Enterococcus faecium]NVE08744.1 hypothetical protein [Enterococcus faecium]NVF24846.1 hypothetical protein [Enterococcus faecium]
MNGRSLFFVPVILSFSLLFSGGTEEKEYSTGGWPSASATSRKGCQHYPVHNFLKIGNLSKGNPYLFDYTILLSHHNWIFVGFSEQKNTRNGSNEE